jgi:hypothetical protein
MFVRKAVGSLRLCIDYRGLIVVTRKDAYPLPSVDDTLDELKDANFHTHLDLPSGFSPRRRMYLQSHSRGTSGAPTSGSSTI